MTAVHREPAVAGHLPGSPDYRRVVVALFAAGVTTFSLIYCTQALLPELTEDFGVSSTASTLTLSLTTLGLGLALLVAGPLSDAIGRTPLIHLSVFLSAAAAVACAVAPTWESLLVLRFLQGVFLAGLPAVASAYLREELHPSTHARVAGLYIGGTALGGMTGRLITGPVGELAGWRWAMAAVAALALICAVLVRLLLPASRRFAPRPPGLRSLATMARRALADPALLTLYAIGGLGVGAMVAVFNTLGFRLAAAPFGLGLAAASLVFLAYPVGSVSSAVAGRLADRFGRRAVLPVGSVIAIAGVLVTLVPALWAVALGLALITTGFFAIHGVATGWVPARAHAGGVASGQAASFYLVSFYLGSSVFGSLAATAWTDHGWPGVVVLATGLLAVTGLLGGYLRRTPALAPRG